MRPHTALTAVVALLATLAMPARAQQEWSFEAEELVVTNLIGQVTVRGHDGPRVVVRARPGGRDADRLSFEVRHPGRAEFHTVFPVEETRDYVYPRMQSGRTTFTIESWRRESSLLEQILSTVSGRDRIEVSGRGGGLEAWADLEVRVPRGVPTRVKVGVGELEARDVEAELDLDGSSGSVRVRNVRGDTRVDTGSGSVHVETVRGSLNVDTGSGSVEASDVEGSEIRIDTGSGSVSANRITARNLLIDTGSGAVRTGDIDAEGSRIDTGSGSVTLSVVRLDRGNHSIDTGSGRVTVEIPTDASVRISAETGSGSIRLDVPGARMHRMSRDELEVEIGEGRAHLTIETGSGGVTIRTR